MSQRTTGTVSWFNDQKGFGFIESDKFDEDVFIHFSEIEMEGFKKLDEDDRVEFEPVETDDGLQAQSLIKIG